MLLIDNDAEGVESAVSWWQRILDSPPFWVLSLITLVAVAHTVSTIIRAVRGGLGGPSTLIATMEVLITLVFIVVTLHAVLHIEDSSGHGAASPLPLLLLMAIFALLSMILFLAQRALE